MEKEIKINWSEFVDGGEIISRYENNFFLARKDPKNGIISVLGWLTETEKRQRTTPYWGRIWQIQYPKFFTDRKDVLEWLKEHPMRYGKVSLININYRVNAQIITKNTLQTALNV